MRFMSRSGFAHSSAASAKKSSNPAGAIPRPAAWWSHVEKGRELAVGLFAVERHDYCVAKRTQHAPFIGSYQKRTAEQ